MKKQNTVSKFNVWLTGFLLLSIVAFVPFVSADTQRDHPTSGGGCGSETDKDCDGAHTCGAPGMCATGENGTPIYAGGADGYDLDDSDPAVGGMKPPPPKPF